MKFRVAEPCPHCKCRCEEYNESTGHIGCPQCEKPRELTLSYEGKYFQLVELLRKQFNEIYGPNDNHHYAIHVERFKSIEALLLEHGDIDKHGLCWG